MSGNNSFNQEAKNLTITVVDSAKYGMNAEASAMLSALCSRSKDGPRANLEKVMREGADKFMSTYLIGYGHDSIGKCSSSKVFITGISMIAINHLQNLNPLYAGQESSTRYIPFSAENVVIPESIQAHPDALETYLRITDILMATYTRVLDRVYDSLMANLEKPDDVSDAKWEATVRPRSFDICRSLLPSGLKTVGVWDGNLENFRQVIGILANHSNLEVRQMASDILEAMLAEYPSSFTVKDAASNDWLTKHSGFLLNDDGSVPEGLISLNLNTLDVDGLDSYTRDLKLWERPRHARLPDDIGHYGRASFAYSIDFGGFRDLNRHRKGNIRRSLMEAGTLHSWYREQFANAGVYDDVNVILGEVHAAASQLRALGIPSEDIEYMLPMGSLVDVEASYPIDNAVYVAELRSGVNCHATVREVAINMGNALATFCNFPLYINRKGNDVLDTRRAEQTIIKK